MSGETLLGAWFVTSDGHKVVITDWMAQADGVKFDVSGWCVGDPDVCGASEDHIAGIGLQFSGVLELRT